MNLVEFYENCYTVVELDETTFAIVNVAENAIEPTPPVAVYDVTSDTEVTCEGDVWQVMDQYIANRIATAPINAFAQCRRIAINAHKAKVGRQFIAYAEANK